MALKHHTPAVPATVPPESADAAGGLEFATAERVTGLPVTAEPSPAAHTSDPAAPVTWLGLQMKNETVPVGVPPTVVPVTTALSYSVVPSACAPERATPLPSDGVVTVLVGICRTMKHSELPVPEWV